MMPITTARLAMGLVILGVIVALVVFGPSACTSLFSAKQEARTAKGQGKAAIEAGAEATNTVATIIEEDAATDKAVKEGYDDIRNASEDQRGTAAERAACRLRAYRDSERCAALRNADSGDSSGADASR